MLLSGRWPCLELIVSCRMRSVAPRWSSRPQSCESHIQYLPLNPFLSPRRTLSRHGAQGAIREPSTWATVFHVSYVQVCLYLVLYLAIFFLYRVIGIDFVCACDVFIQRAKLPKETLEMSWSKKKRKKTRKKSLCLVLKLSILLCCSSNSYDLTCSWVTGRDDLKQPSYH